MWDDSIWLGLALVVVIITNLVLLYAVRLKHCIQAVALQGLVMGALPLMLQVGPPTLQVILLSLAFFGVKALLLPWLLSRSLRRVQVRSLVEPYIGHSASLLAGIGVLILAMWLTSRLPLPADPLFKMMFPVAFAAILSGLIIIVTRRKALSQVIGYLAAENGISLLGAPMVGHDALWLELSILLDVCVGVLVMGIAIHHINQAFDSIDVDRFAALKD